MENIQDIVRVDCANGDRFEVGKNTKDADGNSQKIKIIGTPQPQNQWDLLYYIVQFDNGGLIRVYDVNRVFFGLPRPNIEMPKAGLIN